MNITWLGQSGYLLEHEGQRLLMDPYFSDIVERREGLRRLIPPPFALGDLSPDALLITHNHLDHFDPETVAQIANLFPDCRLLGPASVMEHGKRVGFGGDRLLPIAPGETVRLAGVAITATPARHSDPAAVGFILQTGNTTFWFSGDTLYSPELAAQIHELAGRTLDVAFVCINGRLGNMNLQEAATLIAELKPRFAIPTHYGMFAENTADPQEFIAACDRLGQTAVTLECGRSIASASLLGGISQR